MPSERVPQATLLARHIWSIENGSDRQLAKAASFLGALAEARIGAQLDAESTHEALQCAGEAVMAQLAARNALVKLHRTLQVVAGQVGIPEYAGGGAGKVPPGTGEGFNPGEMPMATGRQPGLIG